MQTGNECTVPRFFGNQFPVFCGPFCPQSLSLSLVKTQERYEVHLTYAVADLSNKNRTENWLTPSELMAYSGKWLIPRNKDIQQYVFLCFLSVTKMGIYTEHVRCKCIHGRKPWYENEKQNKRKHKSGTEEGWVKQRLNAEGLPSCSGENWHPWLGPYQRGK